MRKSSVQPVTKRGRETAGCKTGRAVSVAGAWYNAGVLRNALHGPAPKYERLIAKRIGTTPQTIWPSRYHADGTPKGGRGERGLGRYKRKTIKRNGSTAKNSCNVKKVNNAPR